MAFKLRSETSELLILRILNTRMELTEEEKKHYSNLEKGFEGEVQFDSWTEKLQSECHILNDLLLEFNNSKFQLDSTIIYQGTIYLFEVKNYEGEFIFYPDRLETTAGKEYKNPQEQLKRSTFLLRQLLQHLGFNLPIEGFVVYINREFTQYQAPLNEPNIFYSQLESFIKKLNKKSSRLTNRHKQLAEKLVSLHRVESPYGRLRNYHFDEFRKGITCCSCNSFNVIVSDGGEKKVVCRDCLCEESVESAVLRSVIEIKLLFPDMKITTNVVWEWCRVVGSKKMINRLLRRNFTIKGHAQWSYYE